MHQVTPPEEPVPVIGVPCVSGGINPSSHFGGSSLGINSNDNNQSSSPLQVPQQETMSQSPQHLQGTIV